MPKPTQPPHSPSLPSITSLGWRIAALDAAYQVQDAIEGGSKVVAAAQEQARAAKLILGEQIMALRDLIATMPADTLADAAVQVSVANGIAAKLEARDHSQTELGSLTSALVRITLSILPVIAVAAGLDMDEMGWSPLDHLRAKRFYGLDDVDLNGGPAATQMYRPARQ